MTLQVCGDDGVPLVFGHVEQHPLAQDAGHGDDPVDLPPPFDGGVHDPLAAGHRAHVLGHGHGLTAGRLDLFDHGLGHLAGGVLARQSDTDVGHHHLGALGRARQRAGAADADPRPGDDHSLSVEEPCHLAPSGDLSGSLPGPPARRVRTTRAAGRRLDAYENTF